MDIPLFLLEILNELYCISSSNRIYMSTFSIEGKMCNTSKQGGPKAHIP